MKHLTLAILLLIGAPQAVAQSQEIPPELVAYLDEVADELGATHYGSTVMGVMEEDEETTVLVGVASDRTTYIQIACDDFCEAIHVQARNSAGAIIDVGDDESPEQLLTIPVGAGGQIHLELRMGYCDEWECEYAVQAFVR